MGCVNSKQVKSPSKGSSWGKAVRRGFTIQIDRSIKTSDEGYLAAVFSAKYVVANPSLVKALEEPESLSKFSGKGSFPHHTVSPAPKINSKEHASEKPWGPIIPLVSTDHESRVPTTKESRKESVNGNSETINILELMEGLAEAEVSATIEQWHGNHEASMSSTSVLERHDKPSDDAHTQRRSGKTGARRSRPRSFSSFKSTEDVDCALSARRSGSLPSIKSSRKAQPANEQGKVSSKESSLPPDALMQKGTSFRDANVGIDSLRTEAPHFDGKAFRSRENLRRALSFKYMLSDNSSKKLGCIISDLNSVTSQKDEANAKILRRERLVVAASRVLGGGKVGGASTLGSSEFSPAVSFKDWLPSINYPSICPYLECDSEHSVFDAIQNVKPYASTPPHHFSHSPKTSTFYPQVVTSPSPGLPDREGIAPIRSWVEEGTTCMSATAHISTRVEEGTAHSSARVEEDYAAPIFDPEMLDSFEKAMQYLSKEEWDALRGMEDSPRTFLRLVKALKKSSSNSMRHNLKAFGTDASDCAESLDMKRKRLSVGKKLAYMRQCSLEAKKALAKQVSLKQGRGNVVFYSSTTQANPKMYEDCNQVRNILKSVGGICYDERSVSEMLEHEQELSYALNISAAIVPTIFVKGKYLVGIDSIMQLYKKGLLDSMLQEAVSFGSKATSMQGICKGSNF